MFARTLILTVPLLLVSLFAGCGGRPPAEVERGRAAVVAALDDWQAGRPASAGFAEELRDRFVLVGYTLGTPRTDDPAVLRYPVTLRLRDRKGNATEREAVYAYSPGPPPVLTRDPFF